MSRHASAHAGQVTVLIPVLPAWSRMGWLKVMLPLLLTGAFGWAPVGFRVSRLPSNLARQPGADSDDGDDVDWDAEFAELVQNARPPTQEEQASRLSPPPSEAPPRPVPRIRGSGRAGSGAGSRRAPAGEAFSKRREIVAGKDAGPAPLSRNGPVNPDKRRREAAWAGRIGTPSPAARDDSE